MAMAGRGANVLWPRATWERWTLVAILVAGLALRLAVWNWHRLYPLGGDEREYFDQALTWLRGEGYHDLSLMRPPLYPAFLAVIFQLFDSQVQRVRLVQAIIGVVTIYLQWLLAHVALARHADRHTIALAGAFLVALNYTLADKATELLTETVFLFGLTLVLVLLAAMLGATDDGRTRTVFRFGDGRWWLAVLA